MPHPFSGRRRQPVFERANVILVHLMRFQIAVGAILQLILKSSPLLHRIVQLAEGIRDLEPTDVQLKPFNGVQVVRPLLRERRHFRWKICTRRLAE